MIFSYTFAVPKIKGKLSWFSAFRLKTEESSGSNPSKDNNGSIAQLVQSICLTSRGSAVRTRVLPLKTSDFSEVFLFYTCSRFIFSFLLL